MMLRNRLGLIFSEVLPLAGAFAGGAVLLIIADVAGLASHFGVEVLVPYHHRLWLAPVSAIILFYWWAHALCDRAPVANKESGVDQ